MDDNLEPDHASKPTVVEHEVVHRKPRNGSDGRASTSHENHERKLADRQYGTSVSNVPGELIPDAMRFRVAV